LPLPHRPAALPPCPSRRQSTPDDAALTPPSFPPPPPSLLPTHNSVVIKGGDSEEAVLCTADKTFALKYVETTNTLLLVPPVAAGEGEGEEQEAGGGAGAMDVDGDAAGCTPAVVLTPGAGLQTQLAQGARARRCVARARARPAVLPRGFSRAA